jgi:hypothetical protein
LPGVAAIGTGQRISTEVIMNSKSKAVLATIGTVIGVPAIFYGVGFAMIYLLQSPSSPEVFSCAETLFMMFCGFLSIITAISVALIFWLIYTQWHWHFSTSRDQRNSATTRSFGL